MKRVYASPYFDEANACERRLIEAGIKPRVEYFEREPKGPPSYQIFVGEEDEDRARAIIAQVLAEGAKDFRQRFASVPRLRMAGLLVVGFLGATILFMAVLAYLFWR